MITNTDLVFISEMQMLPQLRQLLFKEWEFVKLTTSYLSTHIARVALSFVTILFAGTISQAHLDGVGLTCTLYNVCIMSVSQGYGYVFETYGPQVYGPSKSGELTTVLMKCLLQGVMLHLVIMGPYLNLVYIFDMLPQSGLYPALENGQTIPENQLVDFRDVAAHFLRITMLFQLLEYGVFISCTYFAIQGKNKLVYVVCGIMVATHALGNYLFVSVLEMEVVGLGIAGFTGRFLGFSASLAICFFGIKTGRFPWKGFSRKVFLGWKNMIILGLCGAALTFVDFSLFEITSFLSQFVNMATLSAVIILMQILQVMWSVMFAIALTASNLIGRALAEGNVLNVKLYIKLTLFNAVLALIPIALGTYIPRRELVGLFTQDSEVIDLFARNFWLAILGISGAFMHMGMIHGVLTGFGQQKFAAFATTTSCYLIGLPLAISSIFLTDLGLTGILIGWTSVDMVLLLVAAVKMFTIDIEGEVGRSNQRVKESTGTYGSLEKADKTKFENQAFLNETKEVNQGERLEDRISHQNSEDVGQISEVEEVHQDSDEEKFLIEEDSSSTRSYNDVDTNREVKTVLGLFLVSGVLFVCLVSVSFFRG